MQSKLEQKSNNSEMEYNILQEEYSYLQVANCKLSEDNKLLSNEMHQLKIKYDDSLMHIN
jgi:predicted nuclease with TOPRIM domain